MAGKQYKSIAELYESRASELENAIDFYEKVFLFYFLLNSIFPYFASASCLYIRPVDSLYFNL